MAPGSGRGRKQRRLADHRAQRTDSQGEFWLFDAPGLEADRTYELRLLDASGARLCDPWPLATFPHPQAEVERFRLLIYTCAGGHDLLKTAGRRHFLPLPIRRRLLTHALSFGPQAIVANGDHIYWDQRTGRGGLGVRSLREVMEVTGEFDRALAVLGSTNEGVLKRSVGPQIAQLYGTLLRSTPVFFLQDDHDYFDGDRVSEFVVPFPTACFVPDCEFQIIADIDAAVAESHELNNLKAGMCIG